ncbi:MAG TPA: YfhO family protein, partial [Bacteroidota bacterium]|nr:YfhO family protein [Bacteroidota bacterium]
GFGSHTYQGPLTQQRPVPVNTYWGAQPFVDAPHYFGVVILILAIVGFFKNRGDSFVQFLGIVVAVSLFISFGREFPLVYDLMYNYFPLFNKFRIPSMILMLLQVMIPLLAGYGILSLLKTSLTPESKKKWKSFFIGMSVLLVVSLVGRGFLRGIYESFFPMAEVATRLRYAPAVVSELYSFVFTSVANDLTVASTLILVVFASLYIYLQQRMKFTTFVVILGVAILADLWRVDSKPMHPQPRVEKQQVFSAPDYVKFLQRDSTLYRVLELVDGQPPYSNLLAFWRIQSAYGYQGAKLRAYQDMIDVAGITNPLLWQLMDVKYILSNQGDTSDFLHLEYEGTERKVYSIPIASSRAFFVNRYEVAGGLEILRKISAASFDPRDVAYFQNDPRIEITPPSNGASVKIVRYGIQDLELNVTATGNNLLFLSETYYPKGWKAFIDGKETQIYCLDYLFRGVVIPPGDHKLEMRFEPGSFSLGKNLSLASNVIVVGLVAFAGFRRFRKFQSLS